MSISNDEVSIVVNPEKIEILLQDNSQSINVNAESITIQIASVLSNSGDTWIVGETPNGAINGQNATFTSLHNFVPESINVILNSTIQTNGVDYYTTGLNTIIMNVSPIVGDILRLTYKQG